MALRKVTAEDAEKLIDALEEAKRLHLAGRGKCEQCGVEDEIERMRIVSDDLGNFVVCKSHAK